MSGIKRTDLVLDIEVEFGEALERILYKKHWLEHKSPNQIAKELAVTQPTVSRWLKNVTSLVTEEKLPDALASKRMEAIEEAATLIVSLSPLNYFDDRCHFCHEKSEGRMVRHRDDCPFLKLKLAINGRG